MKCVRAVVKAHPATTGGAPAAPSYPLGDKGLTSSTIVAVMWACPLDFRPRMVVPTGLGVTHLYAEYSPHLVGRLAVHPVAGSLDDAEVTRVRRPGKIRASPLSTRGGCLC